MIIETKYDLGDYVKYNCKSVYKSGTETEEIKIGIIEKIKICKEDGITYGLEGFSCSFKEIDGICKLKEDK